MNAKQMLLMLAVALMWHDSSAWGYDMRYSSMEQRLSRIEKKINQDQKSMLAAKSTAKLAAKPAAFLSDEKDDADEECGESCGDAGCCSCCESKGCGESCCCRESSSCSESCNCGESCGCGDQCNQAAYCGKCYTEVQVSWLRTHINEDAFGKLSEQYKFTPRLIMGYEDPNGVGGRIRYWRYNHTTESLSSGGDEVVLDFTTVDFEATSRFQTRRTDLVVAGGFRWFDGEIGSDGDQANSQMPGMTVAADLRSVFCGDCRSQWAAVGGARWSILGGDWEGDDDGLIEAERDDNIVVQELYGGVEYACHRGGIDMFARLVFEVQSWHSDVLGESTATDTIGLVGPGVHFGANF